MDIAERVARALNPPKYRGYFNTVNSKPQDSWIKVFCSDWNKDHWAFYAYIGVDSYREDLRGINSLVERLNWRDGDVYVELIDCSEGLSDFYHKLYDLDWEALNPDIWEKHLPLFGGKWMDGNCTLILEDNSLKIGKLGNYLAKLYRVGAMNHSRQSTLLLGPPGIGKSMSCRSLAEKLARGVGKEFVDYDDDKAAMILAEPDKYFVFVDLRLTECEPSDLLGLPQKVDGSVRFSPLMWAKCLSKAAGLLLLDELTNIQRPDLITVSYKLVFDREAGFTKFHEDVMIVSAGNRPEHSSVRAVSEGSSTLVVASPLVFSPGKRPCSPRLCSAECSSSTSRPPALTTGRTGWMRPTAKRDGLAVHTCS